MPVVVGKTVQDEKDPLAPQEDQVPPVVVALGGVTENATLRLGFHQVF
jgi:hypothetical protein